MAFFTGPSLLEDLPDQDAELVEDGHGDGHGEQRVRVLARRDDGGDDEDHDDGGPSPLLQLLAGDDTGHLEEDQHDRELEGDAERRDDQDVEADVPPGAEERRDALAAHADQEVERLREGQDGHDRSEGEQHDRRGDERDGVALLALVQARGDETPQLPEQHRRGEEDGQVAGDFQPGGEALERVGDDQVAADSRVPQTTTADGVAVRLAQEVQDRVVQEEGDDPRQGDGDDADDDAPAQFGQVLNQRHPLQSGVAVLLIDRHQDQFGAELVPGRVVGWGRQVLDRDGRPDRHRFVRTADLPAHGRRGH